MASVHDWSPKRPELSLLRTVAPSLLFSVRWDEDDNFLWDGEGPDPREEGYIPHDVTVVAEAIVNGELREGKAYLGGVYEKFGKRDPDIHGYLLQMLYDALKDLMPELPSALLSEAREAGKHLKELMRKSYEAQRLRHERSEYGEA